MLSIHRLTKSVGEIPFVCIYFSCIFSSRYADNDTGYFLNDNNTQWTNVNLSMLQVSNSIRHEFIFAFYFKRSNLSCLFSSCTFVFTSISKVFYECCQFFISFLLHTKFKSTVLTYLDVDSVVFANSIPKFGSNRRLKNDRSCIFECHLITMRDFYAFYTSNLIPCHPQVIEAFRVKIASD